MTAALSEPKVVQLSRIRPCPENDGIYAAPSMDDPDINAMSLPVE